MRAWLAVSPVMAAGVLAAHGLAYRLTRTTEGSLHDYLDHAPQLLVVIALIGCAGAACASRLRLPPAWPFPLVAVVAFVVQEHVERGVHTGEVPWLLESPAFVVGLLLQLPIALLTWALARRLLGALAPLPPFRRARGRHVLVQFSAPVTAPARPVVARPLPGRGPPLLS
jgi:hypothetical protein